MTTSDCRMRFRFTIRDLLWLTLVVALVVAWWIDHGGNPRPQVNALYASEKAELADSKQRRKEADAHEIEWILMQDFRLSDLSRRPKTWEELDSCVRALPDDVMGRVQHEIFNSKNTLAAWDATIDDQEERLSKIKEIADKLDRRAK